MTIAPTKEGVAVARNRSLCRVCNDLAEIMQGTSNCMDGTCTVNVDRSNLNATVLGRRVRAGEIVGISVIFEASDYDGGQTLSLLEATLLQEEVNPFVRELERYRIKVTAIHNHWLFDRPRLMYLHAEAVMDPIDFADAVARAIKTLRMRPRRPQLA